MVPVIALTVVTSPGFAHFLWFLRPLAQANAVGSGVVQGLIPAILLYVVIGTAVWAIKSEYARAGEDSANGQDLRKR